VFDKDTVVKKIVSKRSTWDNKTNSINNNDKPQITHIRSIAEEAASTKGMSSFAIHFHDGERKTMFFQPTKNVNELIKTICIIRNLIMDDFEITVTMWI